MKATSDRRGAFTLVELLMVILIIGMLTSLITAAAFSAMLAAKTAQVKLEINQLDMALQKLKAKHGNAPDNNWGNAAQRRQAVVNYLKRRWNRFTPTTTQVNLVLGLKEAELLVFWLGGRWDGNKMTGFHANPRTPFAAGGQREAPAFSFEEGRLADRNNNGFPEFYPTNTEVGVAPFVYFASQPNGSYNANSEDGPWGGSGRAKPYWREDSSGTVVGWVNPDTWQIIAAGVDNHYGANNNNKSYPSGTNYGVADMDNITNFSERTLKEALP